MPDGAIDIEIVLDIPVFCCEPSLPPLNFFISSVSIFGFGNCSPEADEAAIDSFTVGFVGCSPGKCVATASVVTDEATSSNTGFD